MKQKTIYHFHIILSLALIIFLLGNSSPIFAQKKAKLKQEQKRLQQQKNQLLQEMVMTKKLLGDTRNNKKNTLQELQLLETQILNREGIIDNIQQEIAVLDTTIIVTAQELDSLTVQLKKLKDEYADLIRQSYLHNNPYDKVLFLFAAKDFNDAYRRLKYMEYYGKYRKSQAEQILATQDTLAVEKSILASEKLDKENLLLKEETEKATLEKEQVLQNQLIAKLKKEETTLLSNLKQEEKNAQQLEQEITQVVQKIMIQEAAERAARQKARRERLARQRAKAKRQREKRARAARQKAAAKKKAPKAKTQKVTKKTPLKKAAPTKTKPSPSPKPFVSLGVAFEKSKGKLPWPTDKGVVTGRFGRNRHPVLRHITTTNNGLDITAPKGSKAKAVFDGRVSNIIYNPSFQWAVIVSHESYFTVYSNLSSVAVKQNMKVSKFQTIGTIATNLNAKTTLHLEVWKGSTKLNPIYWLKRRR